MELCLHCTGWVGFGLSWVMYYRQQDWWVDGTEQVAVHLDCSVRWPGDAWVGVLLELHYRVHACIILTLLYYYSIIEFFLPMKHH